MKVMTKALLAATVAMLAISILAAPSEAAKKKRHRHRAAAHSMTCHEAGMCSTACHGNSSAGDGLCARWQVDRRDLHAGLSQGAVPAGLKQIVPRLRLMG
jgi:hypothetical protein